MVPIFLLVFSFVYENAAEVGKMFKGPFSAASLLDGNLLLHEHTRYTLACEDNGSKALIFHLILLKGVQGRTAVSDPTQLWKDGIVPYVISNKLDDQQKYKIHVAIEEFHSKTCALFVPYKNESEFLMIGPGKGCSSNIGKNQFEAISETRLRPECFLKPGTLLHELMHILGFVHEHNRPDRDQYVKIIGENVMEGFLSQFEKYTWDEVQNLSCTYDYGSVMHYGVNFFSKDRTKITIMPLKMGVEIGQRQGFSQMDIFKINKLYNCIESECSSLWYKEDPEEDC